MPTPHPPVPGPPPGGLFSVLIAGLSVAAVTTVGVIAIELQTPSSRSAPDFVNAAESRVTTLTPSLAPGDSASLEPPPPGAGRLTVADPLPPIERLGALPAAPVGAGLAVGAAMPATLPTDPAEWAGPPPSSGQVDQTTASGAVDPAAVPAAGDAPREDRPGSPTRTPFAFTLGSFNVLGSQHSRPGGQKPAFPAAAVRTAQAAGLLEAHGVDVLGAQELQDDQLRQLRSATGMAAYPGTAWGAAETDNSVLWDPRVFELVSGRKFSITFVHRQRPQPVVRLRHRETGREIIVVNTHASPGEGSFLAERRAAQATLVAQVRRLRAEGVPVFVTGDMNDREEFFCRVLPAAGLTAANGGSTSGPCRPPAGPIPVDWIAGSGASWSDYRRDTRPVQQRISDHFLVSARATVG